MKRFAVLIVALLVGAAAPARAWCEASCLAPVHHAGESAMPHCPGHESTTRTAITASSNADCPIVESARPNQSRLEIQHLRTLAPAHLRTITPSHPRTPAPSQLRILTPPHLIPLRI